MHKETVALEMQYLFQNGPQKSITVLKVAMEIL
jgi:hypothetical protein